jgi:hypothetical protein
MAEGEKQEKAKNDLERMTVKELRAIAAEETDLAGIHAMKKAELLTAIKEVKGITERKAKTEALSGKELKAKVAELKAKKEEFRKARDRRMVEVLRRRINRAKKKTRKLAQS